MTYLNFMASKTRLRAFALTGPMAAMAFVSLASGARSEPASLALGRHLAGECNGCHGGGAGTTIPPIAGRPAADVVAALKALATGKRVTGDAASATMVSVAQSLDETQMAAVAAFLATLPPALSPR